MPSHSDFAAVVREHWSAVHRLARSLAGDGPDADDLTQETFLRAIDRWSSFEAGSNVRAWLMRIATNAFFDERRRRKRRPTESLATDPPAAGGGVDYRLETAEMAAVARAAMQELTPLTRTVFHLRAQEDLSFREIAEIAGTTEQAARWHMRHARVTLLKHLGDDASPAGSE